MNRTSSRMSLNLLGRISLIFFILLSNNAHSDDRAELLKLENYLNSLQHIVAKFVQVDANGNTQRGNFFLSRPGKLKWDYVEPKRISILFKNNKIFYHDKNLDQRSEYKTQDSLLYFLIAPKISFLSPDSQYYLQSFSNTGKEIALEVKKHNQTKGEVLVLRFSTAPVSLTSVEVKGSLRIFIDSVIEYPTLDQNLFNP